MLKKFLIYENKFIRNYTTKVQNAISLESKWKSVVGLEVHAQIATESKLFSGSETTFGSPSNTAVSYFDASIPGTLPVLNKKCVEYGVKTALALGCQVNKVSMFDRKHYFYADLPTGYQITQQRSALANNGEITFPVIQPGKKVYHKTARLLQLQLEQDSGKSLHDEKQKRSLVDLNRAGLPLMELVFAPDLETGEEASSLVKELVLTLKCLQTCSCKMEEGALRVDANISVHKVGEPLGVRTEVKNIGSIRSISQAITYEIERQFDIIAQGGVITNETRSWDAENRCTIAMRDKEVLQDYRFMPEPNLPPLVLNMLDDKEINNPELLVSVAAIAKSLPELPEEKRTRLVDEYKLNQEVAIVLVNEPILLEHFLSIITNLPDIPTKLVTNFLINDFLTFCNKSNIEVQKCNLTYNHLKDIIQKLHAKEINLQAARNLIELVYDSQMNIDMLIKTHNLLQISDLETIKKYCRQAIENQPKAAKQYQNGKSKALLAIAGEVFKLSGQKANMEIAVKCLEDLLKNN